MVFTADKVDKSTPIEIRSCPVQNKAITANLRHKQYGTKDAVQTEENTNDS